MLDLPLHQEPKEHPREVNLEQQGRQELHWRLSQALRLPEPHRQDTQQEQMEQPTLTLVHQELPEEPTRQ